MFKNTKGKICENMQRIHIAAIYVCKGNKNLKKKNIYLFFS